MRQLMVWLGALVMGLAAAAANAFEVRPEPFDAEVVRVKDGDTMDVVRISDNRRFTVRLAEVDAPETTQMFGAAAKHYVEDRIGGEIVRIVPTDVDVYRRLVAKVYLTDGAWLNRDLVAEGFAWHFKRYSHSRELANWESHARQQRRGLWQEASPTPPWDYRKQKRAATADHLIKEGAKKGRDAYEKGKEILERLISSPEGSGASI